MDRPEYFSISKVKLLGIVDESKPTLANRTLNDSVYVKIPTTEEEFKLLGTKNYSIMVPRYRCSDVKEVHIGEQVRHKDGYTGIVKPWANGKIFDNCMNLNVEVTHNIQVTWNVMDLELLNPGYIK